MHLRLSRLLSFLVLFVAAMMPAVNADAQLHVDITSGTFQPLPIAIPDFASNDPEANVVGQQMAGVIAADLERSGLFRPISKSAFIEQVGFGTTTPNFASWKQINAAGLVVGNVVATGPGKVKVSFRLWDVDAGQQIAGKQYDTYSRNWRRIAHIIADQIYSRITGEGGYFDTRIVYVSETGPKNHRVKRLAIMDQDGENHKFLTDGKFLVMTPRFSPNSQEILYLSYASKLPKVYLRDLQSGREETVGVFQGMSFAPRFANEGGHMVMSIANNGNTDIFDMDLRSRSPRQLTTNPAIDTSPSYSPDGKSIVFNSDRGGSQQLYMMSSGGGDAKRISFGEGNYSTPVWSPRGDLIAFTVQKGGQFSIGIMRPDGSGERLLTTSWLAEGPSWAPNGRVIVFDQQGGPGASTKLYSVDVTGRNLRQVPTPVDGTDPAWSPLLPL